MVVALGRGAVLVEVDEQAVVADQVKGVLHLQGGACRGGGGARSRETCLQSWLMELEFV
jgi:hypothetical protein